VPLAGSLTGQAHSSPIVVGDVYSFWQQCQLVFRPRKPVLTPTRGVHDAFRQHRHRRGLALSGRMGDSLAEKAFTTNSPHRRKFTGVGFNHPTTDGARLLAFVGHVWLYCSI